MTRILNCECGCIPISNEYLSGMGEYSYIIYCPNCKNHVNYSMYERAYKKSTIKEWNKFGRFKVNVIKDYCYEIIKMGFNQDIDNVEEAMQTKFNLSNEETKVYYERYIKLMLFKIHCNFFKYRYIGELESKYIPRVMEEFDLTEFAVYIYHDYWKNNMERISGRYLEEGINHNIPKEKNKTLSFFKRKNKK